MTEDFAAVYRRRLAEGMNPSDLQLILHPDDPAEDLRLAATTLGIAIGHTKYMPPGEFALVRKLLGSEHKRKMKA